MNYNDIDPRLTTDGRLKLLEAELNTLRELVDAGDRGGFHYLYAEMSNNADARLTAKISTFSGTVGGAAFASNWLLQQLNPLTYPGIYFISQQIAADILTLVEDSVAENPDGTGFLTYDEHFASATNTWQSLGIRALFPGNLLTLDLGTPGAAASVFALKYAHYTGKKLSDFQGVPGYTILNVTGGQIVIDAEGRTTATFIEAPNNDALALIGNYFVAAATPNYPYQPTLFEIMGNVGDPAVVDPPDLAAFQAARRNFTQYSGGAYNGDNNPGSYPPVGNPTISISQTPTNGRDLLVFGDGSDSINAGGGNDHVMSGLGNDTVRGADGDDVLWGQAAYDALDGGLGNDTLRGGLASDQIFGGGGNDVLEGADITLDHYAALFQGGLLFEQLMATHDGHDLMLGGTGNDLILGGYGADLMFDAGPDDFVQLITNVSPSNQALYIYDGGAANPQGVNGSDTLIGGAGSDLMVYTGGEDLFIGGTGDDTYLVSPDFLSNRQSGDLLTIHLEENAADDATWFGHDYVIGNGYGIHEIVFEGLSRSDVTVTYDYVETPFQELDATVQTLFMSLLGITQLDLGNYPIFSLQGSVTITVNATGSSLFFSDVGGAYVGGSNGIGAPIYVAPLLMTQTYLTFEDGIFYNWLNLIGLENFVRPVLGTTPDEADDAPTSQSTERGTAVDMPTFDHFGTSGQDYVPGTEFGDAIFGGLEDDVMEGLSGDDTLNGGAGADSLAGGAGFDIADYTGSNAAVTVNLSNGSASGGHAAGDVYLSIEDLRGSAFGDSLTGNNAVSSNILEGMDGNDTLSSAFGPNDTFMYGGNGNDVFVVRAGNALLDGGAGNDSLYGGTSIDLNYGGAGDDLIYMSEGNDRYDGGDGFDVLSYEFAFDPFDENEINLTLGFAIDRSIGTSNPGIGVNSLSGIEGFRGSRAADFVTGTTGVNLLVGGFGADRLLGLAGNDTLEGGHQNDDLDGGSDNDRLTGGTGNDTLRGGGGSDIAFFSGNRADYTFSTQGSVLFVISASGETDQVHQDVELLTFADVSESWTTLAGIVTNVAPVANPDAITVAEGQLVAIDLRDNDSDANGHPLTIATINGIAITPQTTISMGPGLDLTIRMTAAGVITVEAADPFGADLAPGQTQVLVVPYQVSDGVGGLTTSNLTVTVVGRDQQSDTIVRGTAGDDVMSSGYVDADGDVLAAWGQRVEGLAGNDQITTGTGNDTVYGGEGHDNLYDTGGNDSLYGGAGNDTLRSYAGTDLIDGGDGIDTLDLSFGGTGVVINIDLAAGTTSGTAPDTLVGIENATGTQGANILSGTAGANVLDGQAGNDTLTGLSGNDSLAGGDGSDSLDGGTGSDSMAGGLGNDAYVVDAAGDVVTELASAGTDTVQAWVSHSLAANVEDLVLMAAGLTGQGNSGANRLTGSAGSDTLDGQAGNDSLTGGDGNDRLDGGSGNDSLAGGAGNDLYIVDASADSVVEVAGGGADTVQSAATFTLGAEVEHLVLTGTAAINGTGNALANSLTGNAAANALTGGDGNDTLSGGDGNDTLTGGLGNDAMSGGAGNDSYVVDATGDTVTEAAGGGSDTVTASVTITLSAHVEGLVLTGLAALNGTGNTDANTLTGNTGANLLAGLAGNDTLDGGSGDDTLDGGTGNDSMTGGSGNDVFLIDSLGDVVTEGSSGGTDLVQSLLSVTLGANVENLTLLGSAALNGTGNTLANVLAGNGGANLLSGLDGNDNLSGNGGNDTLDGGAGSDTLDGGTGNDSMTGGLSGDTYIVDSAGDVVVEAAGGGTDTVQSSVTLVLGAEVENLTLLGSAALNGTGNTLANVLAGNGGANLLSGLDGNDNLSGAGGNDTLEGGAGADVLDGGTGNDSMTGGLGNDTYVVDAAGDTVAEAAAGGTDLVQSAITYTLGAEVEDLTLAGTANLTGTGNLANNRLTGNSGANVLSGLAGNDSLYGGDGNDSLDGGDGNDLIDGGTGNDTLVGGAGNDVLRVDSASDLVVEGAVGGTDLVESAVSFVLDANLEHLTLTGSAAINGTGNAGGNALTGNSGANLLTALAGNDTISAGAGNDTLLAGDGDDSLTGGTGNDSLDGGAGNDIFEIDSAADVVVEAAGGGTDTVRSTVTHVLGLHFEHLVLTSSAAINATGNALANDLTGASGANILTGLGGDDRLYGGSGNDTLDGGTGNDQLDGGSGNDAMTGGDGNDTFVVDALGDTVTEAAAGGTDLVQSAVAFTLGTGLENLMLTGSGAIAGTGNALANVMIGNSGANSLSGLDGHDSLSGGSGNDTLLGGAGNDTLEAGSGTDSLSGGAGDDSYLVDATADVIVELAGEGSDTVTSSASYTLSANVETLTLTGTTGLSGTGNALANRITGNAGANSLSGLDGNDTLVGGAGNDSLTGGLGADAFVFTATTAGVDVIADFNELNGGGEEGDVLRFEGLGVGAFVYLGTGAFTGGSNNSEARVSGSQVLVDTNGDGTADITITLTGLTGAAQLAASDFIFV